MHASYIIRHHLWNNTCRCHAFQSRLTKTLTRYSLFNKKNQVVIVESHNSTLNYTDTETNIGNIYGHT